MTPLFQWHTAALTHTGHVRTLNEDRFLNRGDDGLWVVADGMGGHQSGELASQWIVDALAELVIPLNLRDSIDLIDGTLCDVNTALINEAQRRDIKTSSGSGSPAPPSTIGSTIVVMLAWKAVIVILWAGDSRLYRFRDGKLTALTQDHSQVENMVTMGLISQAEASSHPAANIITRAIGANVQLMLDMDYQQVRPDDYFLLCSDGLNKELPDQAIAAILSSKGSPADHCLALVNNALDSGGSDNITVVLTKAEAY